MRRAPVGAVFGVARISDPPWRAVARAIDALAMAVAVVRARAAGAALAMPSAIALALAGGGLAHAVVGAAATARAHLSRAVGALKPLGTRAAAVRAATSPRALAWARRRGATGTRPATVAVAHARDAHAVGRAVGRAAPLLARLPCPPGLALTRAHARSPDGTPGEGWLEGGTLAAERAQRAARVACAAHLGTVVAAPAAMALAQPRSGAHAPPRACIRAEPLATVGARETVGTVAPLPCTHKRTPGRHVNA